MNLSILFRFYKDVEICENRLQILKNYNPNSKIYGLYGWLLEDEKKFKNRLNKYLDDFFTSPETDSFKKRIHGDIFLLDWYQQRWQYLARDSIVIVQRDLVALDSLENIFSWIKKEQVYLPQYGIINKKFENYWNRTSSKKYNNTDENDPEKPHMRKCFLDFKQYIKRKYWYNKPLPYCIFMTAVLPKLFFEKYQTVENIELWFLEYKIPTYCKIFSIEIFEKDLGERNTPSPTNANTIEISKEYIQKEMKKTNWQRMFHPYYQIYDIK